MFFRVALRQIVCDMAQSVLGPISDETLYRLHLWGGGRQAAGGGGGGMDEYIGRAAHVRRSRAICLVSFEACGHLRDYCLQGKCQAF